MANNLAYLKRLIEEVHRKTSAENLNLNPAISDDSFRHFHLAR